MNDKMTIYDALKELGARLSLPGRWMVMDENGMFTVYSKPPYAKKVTTVYSGNDESRAIKCLLDGEIVQV